MRRWGLLIVPIVIGCETGDAWRSDARSVPNARFLQRRGGFGFVGERRTIAEWDVTPGERFLNALSTEGGWVRYRGLHRNLIPATYPDYPAIGAPFAAVGPPPPGIRSTMVVPPGATRLRLDARPVDDLIYGQDTQTGRHVVRRRTRETLIEWNFLGTDGRPVDHPLHPERLETPRPRLPGTPRLIPDPLAVSLDRGGRVPLDAFGPVSATVRKGMAAAENGDWERAADAFAAAVIEDPEDLAARAGRRIAFMRARRTLPVPEPLTKREEAHYARVRQNRPDLVRKFSPPALLLQVVEKPEDWERLAREAPSVGWFRLKWAGARLDEGGVGGTWDEGVWVISTSGASVPILRAILAPFERSSDPYALYLRARTAELDDEKAEATTLYRRYLSNPRDLPSRVEDARHRYLWLTEPLPSVDGPNFDPTPQGVAPAYAERPRVLASL